MKAILLLISLLGCGSIGCSNGAQFPSSSSSKQEFYVTEVNDHKFMYTDNEQGSNIVFKSKEFERCSVMFMSSAFKVGAILESKGDNLGQASISCLGDNTYYTGSPIKETWAKLEVVSEDPPQVSLSFRLYHGRSDSFLEREKSLLVLSHPQFAKLLSDSH